MKTSAKQSKIPGGFEPEEATGRRGRAERLSGEGGVNLGLRLKAARRSRNWTLEEASLRTGVARSTLSKIESNSMSPTFDILQRIARGFELDIVEFFDVSPHTQPVGRRTITRKGTGRPFFSEHYQHELLCTELVHKKLLPFRARIVARERDPNSGWVRHDGEEFLFVLSGTVAVLTELYEPAILEAGDSIYFDSQMGHAVVSVSEADAEVLWVCSDMEGVE